MNYTSINNRRLHSFPIFCYAIAVLVPIAIGQVPSMGKCPTDIKPIPDFDLVKMTGVWFEVEKYPLVASAGGKCITSTFRLIDRDTVAINTRQINRFTGNEGGYVGHVLITAPSQFLLKFPGLPSPLNFETPYWIIATDYDNYLVTFSCRDMAGLMSGKMVWILTRNAQPDPAIMQKAYDALDRYKISKTYLMSTEQVNCKKD